MNRIIQTVSCFLCCLLTILMICGCQTDAASDAKEKSNSDLLGDTDGDGSVSIGDVTVIQQHIANIISLQNNRLNALTSTETEVLTLPTRPNYSAIWRNTT